MARRGTRTLFPATLGPCTVLWGSIISLAGPRGRACVGTPRHAPLAPGGSWRLVLPLAGHVLLVVWGLVWRAGGVWHARPYRPQGSCRMQGPCLCLKRHLLGLQGHGFLQATSMSAACPGCMRLPPVRQQVQGNVDAANDALHLVQTGAAQVVCAQGTQCQAHTCTRPHPSFASAFQPLSSIQSP